MREIPFSTLISKSVDRTMLILFRPFNLKKWLLLLFIAYMAGAIGGGNGSGGGRGGGTPPKEAEAQEERSIFNEYSSKESDKAPAPAVNAPAEEKSGALAGLLPGPSADKQPPSAGFLVLVITPIVILIFGLVVLLTWLSARFRFIWYDSMVKNDASVKGPFIQYKTEGDSLFRFFLLLLLVTLLALGVIGVWAFFTGSVSGIFGAGTQPSIDVIYKVFILPIIALGVVIITLVVFTVFIDDFVVTIMAMDRSLFLPAWRKFLEIFRQNRKDFILYLLVLLGLGILSGVIALIIAIVCILAILIAAAVVFGLPYLIIGALLKANIVFVIYAVIAGIPFAIAAILLLLSVNLPFAVFFRNFSLHYFSSLKCGYQPLALDDVPEAPPRVG
ncbi:hypothetical protein ACFL42_03540 [Candidatus Omnitrophota bacterium]